MQHSRANTPRPPTPPKNTNKTRNQNNKNRHAYERSKPVFNATVDECGAAYISVGDGGNVEGLYHEFIDVSPPPYCADPAQLFTVPVYQVCCAVCCCVRVRGGGA